VKALVLVAAGIMLLMGSTLSSASNLRHSQSAGLPHLGQLSAFRVPYANHLHVLWGDRLLQTGGTATPATPVASPTAVPTGTAVAGCSTCPDPVTLLNNTISVYGQITSAHFDLITDGVQTGIEHLHIDATGDANCKGPSMTAHVTGSDVLLGTSQSRKVNEYITQIKNTIYIKPTTGTKKGTWTKSKSQQLQVFSFPIGNPLLCSATTGGGSGSGSGSTTTSDQLKDVVNLGGDTFQGIKVWHVRATDVSVDANGQTSQAQLDFFISQDHFLPYKFTVTVADSTQNITVVQSQVLTKFGKKVTVKAPKIGSRTP